MPIYPDPAPTLSGNSVTASRFLKSPTLVQRRLRELTDKRFIADVILTGRYPIEGGSILYEVSESMYASDDPKPVAPGGTYPRTLIPEGTAAVAKAINWGEETEVTDAAIKRRAMNPVDKALRKIANTIIKRTDSAALTAVSTAVTQGVNQAAAWDNASADPFLDVMLAVAKITGRDEGYEPDMIVLTDELYARMVANQKVISGLRRESANTVTETGEVVKIGNLTLLRSGNLPSGINRLVLDSTQLGGLGFEDLESPEFSGSSADGVESRVRRDPGGADKWLLAGRRSVVPIVEEPNSACAIGTGF